MERARGPAAQRLQPIKSNLTEAEFRPFIDYFNLAPLNDAIHKIFTRSGALLATSLHSGAALSPMQTWPLAA